MEGMLQEKMSGFWQLLPDKSFCDMLIQNL